MGLNASEIYKWVGDDGVIHFSDTRPKEDVSVTTIHVEERSSEDYDPATDPYSILNQAKRANESWMERVAAQRQAGSQPDGARKDRRYAFPVYAPRRYTPFTYYSATAYYPVLPSLREPRRSPGATRWQLNALNALALAGQRPGSINSGVHRERVLRSQALPTVKRSAGSSFVIAP
ncbi:MAG: DUF4124 domain-containing protein [Gammaproteobacteria bacterium]